MGIKTAKLGEGDLVFPHVAFFFRFVALLAVPPQFFPVSRPEANKQQSGISAGRNLPPMIWAGHSHLRQWVPAIRATNKVAQLPYVCTYILLYFIIPACRYFY